THEEALMETMQQLANLLSGFQKQFPPTNNQLRASSNPRSQATVRAGQIVTETVQRSAPSNVGKQGKRENQANGSNVVCYTCRGEGHVARQCKEPKRARNSQWYVDKALLLNAQEKGEVLDAKAKAFLADVECTAPYEGQSAMTTTNMFQANHEDAYDFDVDDGPDASIAFMAKLMMLMTFLELYLIPCHRNYTRKKVSNPIMNPFLKRIRFRILNIWHLMISILVDLICRFLPQLSLT
nr:hypothetical protein [Tanacetum cinerariifolium]